VGVGLAPSWVWAILRRHGVKPSPERPGRTWSEILRAQATTVLAGDFFPVDTVLMRRLYALFSIEIDTRRVQLSGITTNPVGEWVTQQARNLSFVLAERGRQAKFLIRDRDAKFTASFDEVFAPEGIRNIATPIRSPRANASAARFIGTVRRECLDRMLVFHRAQLETVLSEFVDHYNGHRPSPLPWTAGPARSREEAAAHQPSGSSPVATARQARRSRSRISTRRVSCSDGFLGTHRVGGGMSVIEEGGGPAFEDLTARARIRNAALKHFSEEGFARVTIRGIARSADVSPGLVRHHFGSKEALREACDDHVVEAMRRVNETFLGNASFYAGVRPGLQPFQRYLLRALIDGSTAARSIFDEIVTMTEQWLARADESRSDPPEVDQRVRAAVVTGMAAGVPLLHEHVSRALSADMFAPEGDTNIALALLDIYADSLISAELAASARAGFDPAQRHSSTGRHDAAPDYQQGEHHHD
jgi:TetR/AcrR family transcriptional regulator, regulator of cefoperazone and chloramphenicol sensitivity